MSKHILSLLHFSRIFSRNSRRLAVNYKRQPTPSSSCTLDHCWYSAFVQTFSTRVLTARVRLCWTYSLTLCDRSIDCQRLGNFSGADLLHRVPAAIRLHLGKRNLPANLGRYGTPGQVWCTWPGMAQYSSLCVICEDQSLVNALILID